MSRKYRQPGYQDEQRENRPQTQGRQRTSREGPKSPVMPGFRQVLRCAMCGVNLPASFTDVTFTTQCPKCGADLHTCKNCVFFDPASRFECSQPIAERISKKDERNTCTYFEARTTVEKETTSTTQRPLDPREAFERLFKK